jgi:flavin reductase (DIM6/NTAB) family NADH-FMN oxidoreductase RutF
MSALRSDGAARGSGSAEKPMEPTASFRLAMRQLASGVCLVTHGEGENRVGLTATSVSSLSVEPPTLIVCINRAASLYTRLRRGDAFGVSVLGAQHAEFADRFASRTGLKGAERFNQGEWIETSGGVSLLADALASFACEAEEVIERHTHAIVVGRVASAEPGATDGALLYWRGAYDRIGWSAEEVSRAFGAAPRDIRPSLKVVP